MAVAPHDPLADEELFVQAIAGDGLKASLLALRAAVKVIWEADKLIEHYTDHGPAHNSRLFRYARKVLQCSQGPPLTEIERYLFCAAIYLHDIGMQADVKANDEIAARAADEWGAQPLAEWQATPGPGYTEAEQDRLRANHHLLSAAWVQWAYEQASAPGLIHAVQSIPRRLLDPLAEIVTCHSKKGIRECPVDLFWRGRQRLRLVAAVLRLADELDIAGDRVHIETVTQRDLGVEHETYWWLHHCTDLDVLEDGSISIHVSVHSDDSAALSAPLEKLVVEGFPQKNFRLLTVLREEGVTLRVADASSVSIARTEPLPPSIREQILRLAGTAPPLVHPKVEELDEEEWAHPPLQNRYHWDDPATLRSRLTPESPQWDADVLLELPPTRVRDIAFNDSRAEVYSLASNLDSLRQPGNLDKQVTILRYGFNFRDVFVLPPGPATELAQRVWDIQVEVVALEVLFHVEAAGAWDTRSARPINLLCVQDDGLFLADGDPGFDHRPARGMAQSQAEIRVPVPDPSTADECFAQAEDRIGSWLAALTLMTGVGFRVLHASVEPVYRRQVSTSPGPEQVLMRLPSAAKAGPLAESIRASKKVRRLAHELNRALCSQTSLEGLPILIGALEEVWADLVEPLMTKQQGRRANTYLRKLLGAEHGDVAQRTLLAMRSPELDESLAIRIAELVPDVSTKEALAHVRTARGLGTPEAEGNGDEPVHRAFDKLYRAVATVVAREVQKSRGEGGRPDVAANP